MNDTIRIVQVRSSHENRESREREKFRRDISDENSVGLVFGTPKSLAHCRRAPVPIGTLDGDKLLLVIFPPLSCPHSLMNLPVLLNF
jgi:hypothetical protein